MKSLMPLAVLVLPVGAQERVDPAVELQRKLESPFLKHADWVTDWDVARAQARERERLILGYFTTAGY